jgi:general secretion pathway protein D
MKLRTLPTLKNAIVLIASRALLVGATAIFSSISVAQAAPEPKRAVEPVTLNFSNADIEAVARAMAGITGLNVVVDPRVKGSITLVTEKPVNRTVAMNQFLAALRLQGFTMVESAGLYKVVPEADAKLQSAAVTVSDGSRTGGGGDGSQITTQIYKLNFESANNLVPILRPLISPNNTINVNPGNNSLIITDYADNLRRMARIIAALDVSNGTDVEILSLRHAIATDLAPLVMRLMESSGAGGAPGQADSSFRTTLIAEPRSNTLILRAANPARVALAKSLIDKLDQPPAAGPNGAAGNIYVVYLKNADATKLAATLRAAMSGESKSASTPAVAPPGAAAAAGAGAAVTGGQVQADTATNSLIITAPEPQYRQLRAVIDKLDARRAQVLVESLIVEVNTDRAAEFGIQWQGALGKNGDGVIGALGTNFGASGKNIIKMATAGGVPSPGTGINIGAAQQTNGVYVLGFLANFLETSGTGNVLSTPNLLTLDNEEAKIVIGENVPFITGQFSNTGSGSTGGSVNPFQTIERKDVGLTLKVKPQINENGTVKLVIYQETSAVKAGTEGATNGPTTNKRTIESTVLVDDGAIVVLGGLLQDKYNGNQEKVPGLGDVPFLGNLFKSESRGRNKTNLMVFLRPLVVRDAAATDRVSVDRYDLMRSGLKETQPVPSQLVPINDAPQLPTLRETPFLTLPAAPKR